MRLVIKDHDAGRNKRPKFTGIFACKFVRLSHIRIAITLWGVWLLENIIGVGCTPRVSEIASWGARQVRWARWTWGTGWIIWPAFRWAWRPRGDVRGPTWRSRRWTAQRAQRGVIWRSRWLVVTIRGSRGWLQGRVVDWISTEILAKMKYWGRLAGCNVRLLMERHTS